jgi:hypothetical protein
MWKTLDDAALDSFRDQLAEGERREAVLVGALQSILENLEVLIGAQRLRDTVRKTATSALHECGITASGKRETMR